MHRLGIVPCNTRKYLLPHCLLVQIGMPNLTVAALNIEVCQLLHQHISPFAWFIVPLIAVGRF
jgi:hypothetical protein